MSKFKLKPNGIFLAIVLTIIVGLMWYFTFYRYGTMTTIDIGYPKVTVEQVVVWSEKGYDLNWGDFGGCPKNKSKSGEYTKIYEISNDFYLEVSSTYDDKISDIKLHSLIGETSSVDIRDVEVEGWINVQNLKKKALENEI